MNHAALALLALLALLASSAGVGGCAAPGDDDDASGSSEAVATGVTFSAADPSASAASKTVLANTDRAAVFAGQHDLHQPLHVPPSS